jgi:predicted XRE-type DNA-binding protein
MGRFPALILLRRFRNHSSSNSVNPALGLTLTVQDVLQKKLKDIAQRTGITHAEIARRAGTSRTRVTAILNDDLKHVSSDLLIRILASIGYRVKVSVVKSGAGA